MGDGAIVFADWEEALRTGVPPDRQRGYREAIVKFRYWLKETGRPAVPETFKAHLEWNKSYLSAERFEIRREALRWYYREGRKRMAAARGEGWLRNGPYGAFRGPRLQVIRSADFAQDCGA
jgi:hypothetical protein